MGNFLIAIGIGAIIISVFLIIREKKEEIRLYNDILVKHKEIIEYTSIIEDIVENLDFITENFLEKLDKEKTDHNSFRGVLNKEFTKHDEYKKNEEMYNGYSNNSKNLNSKEITKDDNIKNEIINLRSLGLNTQEIAKKMNKGIREIEILLKLYEKNN